MTVLENLVVAQHNTLMVASGFTFAGLLGLKSYRSAESAAVDKARYWLDRTGLLARADDAAGSLAYGEQRRLEIARAMCTDPVLLCLDEPAAGLNARESAELNELLKFIQREHKISILLIEHDMTVVMEISDHIVVLDYGVKIADGTPEQIRNDPEGDRGLSRRRGRGGGEGRRGGRAMTAPLLAVRGVKTFYGNIMALKGIDLDVNDRRDRHADRRQRRRQVDADDDDLRQSARRAKARSRSTAATSRTCRRTRSPNCGSRNRPRAGASSRA